DFPVSIAADRDGNCFLVGDFNIDWGWTIVTGNDTVSFGIDTLINDGHWQQIFLARLNPYLTDISGSTVVCAGNSLTYSISPIPNAASYIWSLPSGWGGTS